MDCKKELPNCTYSWFYCLFTLTFHGRVPVSPYSIKFVQRGLTERADFEGSIPRVGRGFTVLSFDLNYRLTGWLLTVVMTALLRGSPAVCSGLHVSHTNLFNYVLTLWVRPTFWVWRERKTRYWLVKVDSWWRGERRGQGSPILENATDHFTYWPLASGCDFTVGPQRKKIVPTRRQCSSWCLFITVYTTAHQRSLFQTTRIQSTPTHQLPQNPF
jgi:hypothetical protein